MLVCHCHRVCDRTIRDCVRRGAESSAEVGAACGAGTACGGCQPTVAALVRRELESREHPRYLPRFADETAA